MRSVWALPEARDDATNKWLAASNRASLAVRSVSAGWSPVVFKPNPASTRSAPPPRRCPSRSWPPPTGASG